MKINIVFLFIVLWCSAISAQNQSPWKRIDQNTVSLSDKNANSKANNLLLFQFHDDLLKRELTAKPDAVMKASGTEITIPNVNGILEKFIVWESSNFEPELQAKYPDIKSYKGIGLTDVTASLNFSLSPIGIQTMILRANGESEFIEKYPEDNSLYMVFSSKNKTKGILPFKCSTEEVNLNKELLNKTNKITASNKVFKTLKLALSCTGEYAAKYGGTKAGALAGMNATLARVNGIFNRDLAVQLNLIGTNDLIIYTNATTDPYSDATVGVDGAWGQELQDNLTSIIGNSNYDLGHLFGASGGGGNAGCIGCVCLAPSQSNPLAKGSAFTSPGNGNPQGDTFDIDFVAHEMGHQLGAAHTFSYEIEDTGVNVEPGSGSTIMGYAGITTDYDIQSNSDDYFAYASINQIQNNLATKSCPVSTSISTFIPIVSAGLDYTIPKGTAFVLKGTGSNVNSVTYCWEQNDSATSADGDNSVAISTKTNGPLFRSLPPVSSAVRYMPDYNNVLASKLKSRWESVSDVARVLHFVLTARDNAAAGTAQTNSDEMIVNVSGTVGPFEVSSQNTDDLSWFQGTKQTITWNVNQTNTLVGSSKVNIKLSIDGGLTFPISLASNTANDGSEIITVPNVSSKSCRILIEPTDNIYYAVNSKAFAIGYTISSTCDTFTFSAPFAIPEQSAYTIKTITFPASTASVSDVNFNVDFTHTFLSDLQMDVVSPQGTIVRLFDKGCGETNGSLLLEYDDAGGDLVCGMATLQTVSPLQPLAIFNGENPAGVWSFRIRDIYQNDTGTLNSASITICTQTFTLVPYTEVNNDLIVSPNPSDGNFNFKFTSKSSSGQIKVLVFDLTGNKLFEKDYANNGLLNENIQLQNKPQAGVYFLTIIDGNRKEVGKIVIK